MDYLLIYLRLLNLKNKTEQTEKALLGKHGLTRNDTLVISALGVSELTMTELVKLCCMDKSTVTKIVKKLLEEGYIEKRSDSVRNFLLGLTEHGKELNEQTLQAFKNLINSAKEYFSNEEIQSLNSLLIKFLNISEDDIFKGILYKVRCKGD